jgi:dihydroorotase
MINYVIVLKNVWATITPYHLTITRNDLFKDNRFNPHMFCLLIVKSEFYKQRLIEVATSGNTKFFCWNK